MNNELGNISNAKARDAILGAKRFVSSPRLQGQHKRLIELARIEAALQRLEAGTYGLCQGCRGEIAL